MPNTLIKLFGDSSTQDTTTKKITFDPNDLKDDLGVAYLVSGSLTSASKIFHALIKHAYGKTKALTDDKTVGLVGQENFSNVPSLETRQDELQAYETVTFRAYKVAPATLANFDPDDTI